ncbi:Inner membrane protein ykgB (fragment) [Capnocytophaga canimorsus]
MFFSLQAVSNLVGIVEILTALALLAGLKLPYLLKYAGWAMVVTFLMTFKLLVYYPWNVAKMLMVFQLPIFFILKDLVLLGFGVMLITGENENNLIVIVL